MSPNPPVPPALVHLILLCENDGHNTNANEEKEEVEQNVRDHESFLIQRQLREEETKLHAAISGNCTNSFDPEVQLEYRQCDHEREVHQLENPTSARSGISARIHSWLAPSERFPKIQWHDIKIPPEGQEQSNVSFYWKKAIFCGL